MTAKKQDAGSQFLDLYSEEEIAPLVEDNQDFDLIKAAFDEFAKKYQDSQISMFVFFLTVKVSIQIAYVMGYKRAKAAQKFGPIEETLDDYVERLR